MRHSALRYVGGPAWLPVLPCAVTVLGFALGVIGILTFPSKEAGWYLVASLALDVLDGLIARRLRAETSFGAELDWASDTALAFGLAWLYWPTFAVLGLFVWQAIARTKSLKFSGRTLMTIGAISSLFMP